jgi:hypothetical protein
MTMSRIITLGLAIVLGMFGGYLLAAQGAVNIAKATQLEFELRGGFAYVHTPPQNTVEVAYLKPTDVAGCKVPQPGTNLNVIRGTIVSVEPAGTPIASRSFDVGGAIIRLANGESTGGPISTKPGHPPAPTQPADTNSEVEWSDTKWLPYVSPDYPTSSLNPDWPNMVDGRLVLKGGRFTGASPSKVAARDLVWEWRNPDGDTPYQQSISDTARYKAIIKGDSITLTFTGARSGLTKLVIKPLTAGEPVVLQLEGKHDMTSTTPIDVGGKIDHFCAFYQLMQPTPPLNKQYLPYLVGVLGPSGATSGGGSGSPGYYCPGDSF